MLKIPNLPGYQLEGLTALFGSEEGTLSIEFIDQGAGHFLLLKTEDEVALDCADLARLSSWCEGIASALGNQDKGERPAVTP